MPIIISSHKQLEGPVSEAVIISSDGRELSEKDFIPDDAYVYNVRGMSPKEQSMISKLIRTPAAPVAPYKPKQIAPLNRSGGLVAKDIHDEMVQDDGDPDYLNAVRLHQDMVSDRMQIVMAYTLVACVDGFNLSDADIAEGTGETAYKNDPNDIDTYRNRISQISEIILPKMDSRHLNIIQQRIGKLTGITNESVDFT